MLYIEDKYGDLRTTHRLDILRYVPESALE